MTTPRSTGQSPSDRSGFTLVELVTTVALILIVTGIALPRVDVQRTRVASAAHELTSILISSQSRAVLNQHDVVLRFDTVASAALIHLDTDNDGALDAGERTILSSLPDGVAFGGGGVDPMPVGGAAVTFTQTRGGLPSLTFHRNGSASQAGAIYLVAGPRGAAEEEHVRAIAVARPTGRSVCHRQRGGAWEVSC